LTNIPQVVFGQDPSHLRVAAGEKAVNPTPLLPQEIIPSAELRKLIESGALASSNLCWTCGSCDLECPVNVATGRLRPQRLVRMANLGMLQELLRSPEIWYCLSCRRCMMICPNRVKPSEVIRFARQESLHLALLPREAFERYRQLFAGFQRARWHAAASCLNGLEPVMTRRQFDTWFQAPVDPGSLEIHFSRPAAQPSKNPFHPSLCFSCSECSSCCPILYERSVFDPQAIIRMYNLGQIDALLRLPAIWLCVECGQCSDACSQTVRGRELIADLQHLAIEKGIVPPDMPQRFQRLEKALYAYFLDTVEQCLRLPLEQADKD
jgi:heterodisulfide reductase subunit C